ncbi:hypothetical protein BDV35DRAFT_365062 [Aspergillus flavus]|uniref:Uncharacterized protein n=1 Tax=Aspergillus flavus TaxID=5059 RepID=A0A5N6GNV5_ASPFL|nr:hypothetical protein BDV35DRAFT_365062 [Aspergillus flavus]
MLLLSPDYALLWIAFAPLYLFPSSYEVWFPRHLRLLLLSCLLGQDTEEFNALVLPGSKCMTRLVVSYDSVSSLSERLMNQPSWGGPRETDGWYEIRDQES